MKFVDKIILKKKPPQKKHKQTKHIFKTKKQKLTERDKLKLPTNWIHGGF